MAWAMVLLASAFEIAFALGLKMTNGFTRLWPSVATVIAAALSLLLLSRALRALPVGTGYAVWTGIGAAGSFAMGIVLFGEPRGVGRVASMALIIAGVIGLRLSTPTDPQERPDVVAERSGSAGRP